MLKDLNDVIIIEIINGNRLKFFYKRIINRIFKAAAFINPRFKKMMVDKKFKIGPEIPFLKGEKLKDEESEFKMKANHLIL
jgi:hypothetical protein